MAKLKLEIELGNEAMQTYEDLSQVLGDLARYYMIDHDTIPEVPDAGRLKDRNGNKVGEWEIVE